MNSQLFSFLISDEHLNQMQFFSFILFYLLSAPKRIFPKDIVLSDVGDFALFYLSIYYICHVPPRGVCGEPC